MAIYQILVQSVAAVDGKANDFSEHDIANVNLKRCSKYSNVATQYPKGIEFGHLNHLLMNLFTQYFLTSFILRLMKCFLNNTI